MLADLQDLAELIQERSSYASKPGPDGEPVDLDSMFADLVSRIQSGDIRTRRDWVLGVSEVMNSIGDGHAGIETRAFRDVLGRGVAPGLLVRTEHGYPYIQSDRESALDPDYPYVRSINDRPIEEWIEAAAHPRYVNQASPAKRERGALRMMRYLGEVATSLGEDTRRPLRMEFVNEAGEPRPEEFVWDFRDAEGWPAYRQWPRTPGHSDNDGPETFLRTNESGIAYVRIAKMSGTHDDNRERDRQTEEQAERVAEIMQSPEVRDAQGLVIDLRGNPGGRRLVLQELGRELIGDGSSQVLNIATVRLTGEEDADELADIERSMASRFLFPATSSHWTQEERQAIEAEQSNFTPDWMPPEPISVPYFLVLSGNGVKNHYDGPVVILTNEDTFSAADVTTGVLHPLSNVYVLGETTGGGSGRAIDVKLDRSDLEVEVSTMASYFLVDGEWQVLDGTGVVPDIDVAPSLDFYLFGGEDPQLDQAVSFIQRLQGMGQLGASQSAPGDLP